MSLGLPSFHFPSQKHLTWLLAPSVRCAIDKHPAIFSPHPFCKASSSTGTEQSTPVSDSSTSTAPCDFGSPRPPPSISDTFRNHLFNFILLTGRPSRKLVFPLSRVIVACELLRHFAAKSKLQNDVNGVGSTGTSNTTLQSALHRTASHRTAARIPHNPISSPSPKFLNPNSSQPIALCLSLPPKTPTTPPRLFAHNCLLPGFRKSFNH
ncbi:uncharacterized protein CLUP02_13166 [Colletotrichum lupini]|uniref:Uncharacterized protein n=1 Tax=Colletotrichum lupini TaxID=145971 RepID=A0A9Q8T2E5_9PEZI|nr:uncharacterized protein CLUP02_13166 [Colletotrichum lupini]UQC87648.1 hypothetical protein CLUP02_13166 [Colletotrichum lupini]